MICSNPRKSSSLFSSLLLYSERKGLRGLEDKFFTTFGLEDWTEGKLEALFEEGRGLEVRKVGGLCEGLAPTLAEGLEGRLDDEGGMGLE